MLFIPVGPTVRDWFRAEIRDGNGRMTSMHNSNMCALMTSAMAPMITAQTMFLSQSSWCREDFSHLESSQSGAAAFLCWKEPFECLLVHFQGCLLDNLKVKYFGLVNQGEIFGLTLENQLIYPWIYAVILCFYKLEICTTYLLSPPFTFDMSLWTCGKSFHWWLSLFFNSLRFYIHAKGSH